MKRKNRWHVITWTRKIIQERKKFEPYWGLVYFHRGIKTECLDYNKFKISINLTVMSYNSYGITERKEKLLVLLLIITFAYLL